MLGWIILGVFVVAIAAIIAWRMLVGKRVKGYLAIAEYWVYTDDTVLPPAERLMDRMINANPHNRRGAPAIGAREGMLFTDIRLHLGVALRDKNPALFRPDLLDSEVEPTAEILAEFSKANAMVRVRYVSEVPLKDFRHLQFLPHYADSVAQMMGGSVVLDRITNQVWSAGEFHEHLSNTPNMERPEAQILIKWIEVADECRIETRGMAKIGMPEWRTESLPIDEKVITTALVMRATSSIFRNPSLAPPYEFEEFETTYVVEPGEVENGFAKVRLFRKVITAD